MNSLFSTFRPRLMRILLLKEIEQEMDTGNTAATKLHAV